MFSALTSMFFCESLNSLIKAFQVLPRFPSSNHQDRYRTVCLAPVFTLGTAVAAAGAGIVAGAAVATAAGACVAAGGVAPHAATITLATAAPPTAAAPFRNSRRLINWDFSVGISI